MSVIAVCSVKGGVGKTSAAVNLAALAAQEGPTLLVDLDPQGSATFALGVGARLPGGALRALLEAEERSIAPVPTGVAGLDLTPADFSLRHLDRDLGEIDRPRRHLRRAIGALAESYDYTILDCPPGIALSVESVLRAADVALVPVEPAALPMRGMDQLAAYLAGDRRLRTTPLYAFLSKVDRRRGSHRRLADELPAERPEVIGAVPYAVEVESMPETRAPLVATAPGSRGATAYEDLWRALAEAGTGAG